MDRKLETLQTDNPVMASCSNNPRTYVLSNLGACGRVKVCVFDAAGRNGISPTSRRYASRVTSFVGLKVRTTSPGREAKKDETRRREGASLGPFRDWALFARDDYQRTITSPLPVHVSVSLSRVLCLGASHERTTEDDGNVRSSVWAVCMACIVQRSLLLDVDGGSSQPRETGGTGNHGICLGYLQTAHWPRANPGVVVVRPSRLRHARNRPAVQKHRPDPPC
ncbi:hypothetical protein K456DRAFT_98065 [Colletotrichum gloeosporioides 23]|nr:hypothetical protein K456DRAFT_98065 [Colletotrichum gloeosporioides 23]